MPSPDVSGLKLLLILEALFAGVYIALTRGILFVYIVSIGAGLVGISTVVGISALAATIIHVILYRYPKFLVSRVWIKFTILHGMERILFIFIPFTQNFLLISVIFGIINCLPIGLYFKLVMFGSLNKEEIKDVTSKRMAALYLSSAIGFVLAMILIAFLPPETKFVYIYLLGSVVGLLCTLLVALMKISHLEGIQIPKGTEKPEKLFSTSSYLMVVLASGNLLLMVWVPYVMDYLGGPDYLAVAMNLAGMIASVAGSLFWRGRRFKTLRNSIGLDAAAPTLASVIHIPIIHPLLSALSAFAYTGSNFIGNFLFAEYNRWLGAIKSSILLTIILSVAQVVVALIGMLLQESYFFIFLTIIGLKIVAVILALITIPEVAVIPEETARTYSFHMYQNSLVGYQTSVELSKEMILITLRIVCLALLFLTLYIIYRILFLMI